MTNPIREEYLKNFVPPQFHDRVRSSTERAKQGIDTIVEELIKNLETEAIRLFNEMYPTVKSDNFKKVFVIAIFLEFYKTFAAKQGIPYNE